jgi:hypothetical protein
VGWGLVDVVLGKALDHGVEIAAADGLEDAPDRAGREDVESGVRVHRALLGKLWRAVAAGGWLVWLLRCR